MKLKNNTIMLLLFSVFFIYISTGCTNNKQTITTSSHIENIPVEIKDDKTEAEAVPEQTEIIPSPTPEVKISEPVKIIAVGDILLGRGVGMRLKNENKDFKFPFEKVADILKKGDVVFGNLEESITSSTHSLTGHKENGKYILKNEEESFSSIAYAGFNLLNLANNHIMDYYEKGLFDTIDILDKNNIAHAGAGKNLDEARKLAVIEKKGTKIGLLSYTDMADIVYKGDPQISFVAGEDKSGVAPRNIEFIKEDIERSKKEAEILIVSLHWGTEESFEVSQEQRDFAYDVLDSGADLILGHHPHQFQGIEMHMGKPIVYSMGNFIFDQNDPENQEGFILDFDYKDKKLISFEAIPIRTIGKIQVVIPDEISSKDLLNREKELSEELGSECEIINNKLVFNTHY